MVHKTCPECSGMLPVASKQCPCGYVFSAKKLPSKPTERKVEIISSRLRPERAKKNYAIPKTYVTPSLGRRQHNKSEKSDHYDSDDEDSMDRSSECQREDDDSPNYHPENEKGSGRSRRELRSGGKENGGKESSSSENGSRRSDINGTKGQAEEGGDEQSSAPRRPRGRPKGSKDKRPRQPKGYRDMGLPTLSGRFSHFMDANGRPMDSIKAKRQRMDYPHDSNDRYLQPWQIDLKEEYMLDYDASTDIYMNISSEKREIFKLILEDINSKISRQNFKPD